MVYASDSSKWRAYQFLDPFAAGSFLVCNKVNKIFCRPDCDAHPTTELRLLIKFVDTTQEAVSLGYVPCESCGPMSVPRIDVNLLLRTVKDCNNRIGFVPPLMDDDESKITETIKENIIVHGLQRRQLVPAISYNANINKYSPEKAAAYSVSKNDSEHYRLIDLACRHLALAAANSIFTPLTSGSLSPASDDGIADKKKAATKKRRGGVLGFKELAAKLKLSAWHFHRVFKSITGLTPKNYGDMCWEYLEKDKMERGASSVMSPPTSLRDSPIVSLDNVQPQYGPTPAYLQDNEYQLNNSRALNEAANSFPYISPTHSNSSQHMLPTCNKRARVDDHDDLEFSPKRVFMQVPSQDCNSSANFSNSADLQPGVYTEQIKYERDFGPYVDLSNRATSVPDLMLYGSTMPSLFGHNKAMGFDTMVPSADLDELNDNDFSPTLAPMDNAPFMAHDPYVPTEDFISEAVFAETDAFNADLFPESRMDLFSNELAMGDPLMMGFVPEIVLKQE